MSADIFVADVVARPVRGTAEKGKLGRVWRNSLRVLAGGFPHFYYGDT